ncbi:MAG: efflux RND transporter periplasmic adaptor subunit [Bacteroidales bacterium]|jgi:HlyD family secretion protein|nr:efflux RND transporter periplasmic adaptor subunit [Bacteroidales bacterium]
MKKKTIIFLCILVVVIGVIVYFIVENNKKDIIINTTKAKESTIQKIITATGYIQPVDKIDVGTQVSGVIEKIFVDFNSIVEKGQILAELDKSTLREQLLQAETKLSSAQSDLTYAQQNFARVEQLYNAKAATPASYEDAYNRLEQAKFALTTAQSNKEQSQVNLSYAEIYSPISGVVLNRAVEEGQTVAASFNTPTLFTIANDLKKMQVEADVDEADIGSVKIGQPVSFNVDSYPDDVFSGEVKQIRLQATVTSNVVTYTVIIDAPNPDEKLFPGMTANVSIVTNQETGVSIPVEATRFTPSAEISKYAEVISTESSAKNDHKHKTVWLKTEGGMKSHVITTGLDDNIDIIVTEGLSEGDEVILSAPIVKKKQKNKEAVANPLMPKGPGGNRNR